MSDIVEQLQIEIPHPAPDVAMQDGIVAVNRANRERRAAAKEIARLRGDAEIARLRLEAAQAEPCPYVTGKTTRYCTLTPFTLTDEEREAISWAAEIACADDSDDFALWNAGIMQRLLERLGGGR